MEFIISAVTDKGIVKNVNQDGLFVSKAKTESGNIAFAVMCDGMGGLADGEIASSSVVVAFKNWFKSEIKNLSAAEIEDEKIAAQWMSVVKNINSKIKSYAEKKNCRVGSTVTVILLNKDRYYIMNIGDTRAYLVKNKVTQLTVDHTLVERQIRLGNITREQADVSSMRSVITRCVGVTEEVYPDFFFGSISSNAVYLLCTDGFRHKVTEQDIAEELGVCIQEKNFQIGQKLKKLVELNKERKENDNISALAIISKEESEEEVLEDDDDGATVQLFDIDEEELEEDCCVEEQIIYIHSDTIL